MITFGLTLGSAAGPVIIGYIFDTVSSYYLAFLVCAILSVIGLIMAAFLRFPVREALRKPPETKALVR